MTLYLRHAALKILCFSIFVRLFSSFFFFSYIFWWLEYSDLFNWKISLQLNLYFTFCRISGTCSMCYVVPKILKFLKINPIFLLKWLENQGCNASKSSLYTLNLLNFSRSRKCHILGIVRWNQWVDRSFNVTSFLLI